MALTSDNSNSSGGVSGSRGSSGGEADATAWTPGLRAAFRTWVQDSIGFGPLTAEDVAREMDAVLLLLLAPRSGDGQAPANTAMTRAELWERVEGPARQVAVQERIAKQRGSRGAWCLGFVRQFACGEVEEEKGPATATAAAGNKRKRSRPSEVEGEDEDSEEMYDDETEGSSGRAEVDKKAAPGAFMQDTISSAFRRWLEAPDLRTGRGAIASERSFNRYAREPIPLAVREWFWVAAEAAAVVGCRGRKKAVDVEGASIHELRDLAQRTQASLDRILRYHTERLLRQPGGNEGQRSAAFFDYLRLFLGLEPNSCVVVLPLQFEEEFCTWLLSYRHKQLAVTQTLCTLRDQLATEHPADCPGGGAAGGGKGMHLITPLDIIKHLNASQARREERVRNDPTHGRPANVPPSHRWIRRFIEVKVAERQRLHRERQRGGKQKGKGRGRKREEEEDDEEDEEEEKEGAKDVVAM